jgi:hypothetical protein
MEMGIGSADVQGVQINVGARRTSKDEKDGNCETARLSLLGVPRQEEVATRV